MQFQCLETEERKLGPIKNAIDAMQCAHVAFREHGLLKDDECIVCCHMINPGVHASDCPVERLRLAAQHLIEFQQSL